MKDLYKILDLEKKASIKEIKKAYKSKAMETHPDKGGDSNKFKEISEAYETLSNPEKKQQYDNFGSVNINKNFNPMDIFNQFETMFQNDIFGPNRIGAPPFGGLAFPNQSADPVTNLFMNMGVMDMSSMNMNSMNNGCFTQTVIIRDGKKTTTKKSNGKTTVTEEQVKDPYTHFNLQ